MNPKAAGYSGTPLAKKLGIAEGSKVYAKNRPSNYSELIAPLPPNVRFETKITKDTDIAHVFVDRKASLKADLEVLRSSIKGTGIIWVSWPKKASLVPTDITEDTIRELALPLGLVDVKVCAVSDIWSGLKLVIRKELR
jgi:hypothetical protein